MPMAILILALIVVQGLLRFLFGISVWHTQTIDYRHKHFSFRTVEFQMQDVGAMGYNKRTVEVFYITPYFMITSQVPANIDTNAEWTLVNEDVNELGLKFP